MAMRRLSQEACSSMAMRDEAMVGGLGHLNEGCRWGGHLLPSPHLKILLLILIKSMKFLIGDISPFPLLCSHHCLVPEHVHPPGKETLHPSPQPLATAVPSVLFLCLDTPHFVYLFISCRAARLFLPFGHVDTACEHGCTSLERHFQFSWACSQPPSRGS